MFAKYLRGSVSSAQLRKGLRIIRGHLYHHEGCHGLEEGCHGIGEGHHGVGEGSHGLEEVQVRQASTGKLRNWQKLGYKEIVRKYFRH